MRLSHSPLLVKRVLGLVLLRVKLLLELIWWCAELLVDVLGLSVDNLIEHDGGRVRVRRASPGRSVVGDVGDFHDDYARVFEMRIPAGPRGPGSLKKRSDYPP